MYRIRMGVLDNVIELFLYDPVDIELQFFGDCVLIKAAKVFFDIERTGFPCCMYDLVERFSKLTVFQGRGYE